VNYLDDFGCGKSAERAEIDDARSDRMAESALIMVTRKVAMNSKI
jgi:hypothetical protein